MAEFAEILRDRMHVDQPDLDRVLEQLSTARPEPDPSETELFELVQAARAL